MIQYGTNIVDIRQLILVEKNEMKKYFSFKTIQISLALNRSWNKVFFFSLITYSAVYALLHF